MRFLQRLNSTHLYTCGTYAFHPLCAAIVSPPDPVPGPFWGAETPCLGAWLWGGSAAPWSMSRRRRQSPPRRWGWTLIPQRGGAGDVWGHGGDTKGWDVLVLGVSEPRCASLGVSLPQPRGDRGATVHVPTSQAARGTTRLFPRPCCPSGLSPAADGAATPLGPVII